MLLVWRIFRRFFILPIWRLMSCALEAHFDCFLKSFFNLFSLIYRYSLSTEGIWWKDMTVPQKSSKFLECFAENETQSISCTKVNFAKFTKNQKFDVNEIFSLFLQKVLWNVMLFPKFPSEVKYETPLVSIKKKNLSILGVILIVLNFHLNCCRMWFAISFTLKNLQVIRKSSYVT